MKNYAHHHSSEKPHLLNNKNLTRWTTKTSPAEQQKPHPLNNKKLTRWTTKNSPTEQQKNSPAEQQKTHPLNNKNLTRWTTKTSPAEQQKPHPLNNNSVLISLHVIVWCEHLTTILWQVNRSFVKFGKHDNVL